MDGDVKEGFARIELLLENMKESLEREMRDGFSQVNGRIDDLGSRFDMQANRLDRQAGLWQTGRRWHPSTALRSGKIDRKSRLHRWLHTEPRASASL
jgi:hypothetical protein